MFFFEIFIRIFIVYYSYGLYYRKAMFYCSFLFPYVCCVTVWRNSVLRATYKKTKRIRMKGGGDDETRAIMRVVVRQVFDHPLPPNVSSIARDVLAVSRRITLWTSACNAPFCSSRRPRLQPGEDYLIMGHIDRRSGHLLLDQRSVVEKWKTSWPAHIQVGRSHCLAVALAIITI